MIETRIYMCHSITKLVLISSSNLSLLSLIMCFQRPQTMKQTSSAAFESSLYIISCPAFHLDM